ncbi:LysR family transcriptional regulator [Paracoccus onubensis]|uniref:LysR family transcriptional regulator n=1 Tax=Paracoccus onubensis TaxID=1675788 RepID=A0A418SN42_9RHOB|nr:LysR family transcriptional regulator [Paracoccus onubensis]RJE82380.1 LysR family transcriptional regulator [Paracoccus onubensis]
MNEIQIKNLDLNLLMVFRVLMDEGSVNRAAEQLGRTPSAVSHALGRLRDQLGDPLLVRVGGIMQPSPRALSLYQEIQPILARIERAVQPPAEFSPTTSTRMFKISGPGLDIVATEIVRRMHMEAPESGLAWQPLSKETMGQIVSGEIDIAFGNANFPLPAGLKAKALPPLKRYVFARHGHPASNDWTTESWMSWPHVVVRVPGSTNGTVEERLDSLGLKRRIGLHAASWSGIGAVLSNTDMLGSFVALCLLEGMQNEHIHVFEPPEPLPDVSFRVIWKSELDGDPATRWIRDIVLTTFDALITEADRRLASFDIIKPHQSGHR